MKLGSLKLKKRVSTTARAIADSFVGGKGLQELDDIASVASSLSSESSSSSRHRVTFENGVFVKSVGETVLLEQAEESLQSALKLIKEASNKKGAWVDARDLLDRTAAALDDAGLALRSYNSNSSDDNSTVSGSKKSVKIFTKNSSRQLEPMDVRIRRLADEVVDKRRRLLGDMLVHDADGIWAKSQYGDGDGLSFGVEGDTFLRVPDEEKDERALIAWASQTGTAKKFAAHLFKVLGGEKRCVCKSMKGIGVRDFAKHRRVYVICSTFGLGRPPREGEVFYSLAQLEAMRCKENTEDLCEGDEEKPLAGTSVAIAALGNSSFKNFARFGFGLAEELECLGASEALETTKIDVKNGKQEQKMIFRKWEAQVVRMEKARLMDWQPPTQTRQKSMKTKIKVTTKAE